MSDAVATTPTTGHELLLALAGRIDDDLLAIGRELVAVGEEAVALELVVASLAAARAVLPHPVRDGLADAVERRMGPDLVRSVPHGAPLPDRTPHRFATDAGAPEVAARIGSVVAGLPVVARTGARTSLAWRLTPAGAAPGPVPHPVVLAVLAAPGSAEVLAYQVGAALARAGIPASVEAFADGEALPAYHRAALAVARPFDPVAADPASAPVPPAVAPTGAAMTGTTSTGPASTGVAPTSTVPSGDALFAAHSAAPDSIPGPYDDLDYPSLSRFTGAPSPVPGRKPDTGGHPVPARPDRPGSATPGGPTPDGPTPGGPAAGPDPAGSWGSGPSTGDRATAPGGGAEGRPDPDGTAAPESPTGGGRGTSPDSAGPPASPASPSGAGPASAGADPVGYPGSAGPDAVPNGIGGAAAYLAGTGPTGADQAVSRGNGPGPAGGVDPAAGPAHDEAGPNDSRPAPEGGGPAANPDGRSAAAPDDGPPAAPNGSGPAPWPTRAEPASPNGTGHPRPTPSPGDPSATGSTPPPPDPAVRPAVHPAVIDPARFDPARNGTNETGPQETRRGANGAPPPPRPGPVAGPRATTGSGPHPSPRPAPRRSVRPGPSGTGGFPGRPPAQEPPAAKIPVPEPPAPEPPAPPRPSPRTPSPNGHAPRGDERSWSADWNSGSWSMPGGLPADPDIEPATSPTPSTPAPGIPSPSPRPPEPPAPEMREPFGLPEPAGPFDPGPPAPSEPGPPAGSRPRHRLDTPGPVERPDPLDPATVLPPISEQGLDSRLTPNEQELLRKLQQELAARENGTSGPRNGTTSPPEMT